MAFQRTRRPSLRSGRSLRSLGSPLNAYPLGGAAAGARLCSLIALALSITGCIYGSSASRPQATRPESVLRFSRIGGGNLINSPSNTWQLQIATSGSAFLSASGTTLILDGRYEGTVPPVLLDRVIREFDRVRSLPRPAVETVHVHGDSFSVSELGFTRSMSKIWTDSDIEFESSELGGAYRAAIDVIRNTAWKPRPTPAGALQRTRRPSLRSGRSLRSLGSPLNAYPLDDA
jgi:hypothetical protein